MLDPNSFRTSSHITGRHRTAWIETGPADGPLIFFLHGWPELGIVWHRQLEHFARLGWRAVAPDMRGYGRSSVPTNICSYTIREIVTDMVELHDNLGGAPAVWVGHDWGAPIAWSMASHHEYRCRGVVGLSVPYMARGHAFANLLGLVDREIYPQARYPVGQWDYWLFYREQFGPAAAQMEADVARTLSALYKPSRQEAFGKPAITSDVRARGGWFGTEPLPPADPSSSVLTDYEFSAFVSAFTHTGFSGANAWYMNDTANMMFADEAPHFGRISRPALFLHGEWDAVCQTVRGRLADPMRADCADLTEEVIKAGHMLMVEQPEAVSGAIERWLSANHFLHQ